MVVTNMQAGHLSSGRQWIDRAIGRFELLQKYTNALVRLWIHVPRRECPPEWTALLVQGKVFIAPIEKPMNLVGRTKRINSSRLNHQVIQSIPIYVTPRIKPLQHVLHIVGLKEIQRSDKPIVVEPTMGTIELAALRPLLAQTESSSTGIIAKDLDHRIHFITAGTIGIVIVVLRHVSEEIVFNGGMEKRFLIHAHNVSVVSFNLAIDF